MKLNIWAPTLDSRCRLIDLDTSAPAAARYDANESGGMTNDMMIKFFYSVIVVVTRGCKNETGRRHIQLTDSCGPHVCLEYLELLQQHGVLFCPRTPNLSHRQQNEDLRHFGIFKLAERRKKQKLQNGLLMLDGRSHAEKTLGFQHTMQCTAEAWVKAFNLKQCVSAWEIGGYRPYTRAPMVRLAREFDAAAKAKIDTSDRKTKRRKTRANVTEQIGQTPMSELLAKVNAAQPAWQYLPSPGTITSSTKIPASLLAQSLVSPSEQEAIAALREKREAQKAEDAEKQLRRETRDASKVAKKTVGHQVFMRVTNPDDTTTLEMLKSVEIEALGVYKGVKWKMDDGTTATLKAQKVSLLRARHPLDFPIPQPPEQAPEVPTAPPS